MTGATDQGREVTPVWNRWPLPSAQPPGKASPGCFPQGRRHQEGCGSLEFISTALPFSGQRDSLSSTSLKGRGWYQLVQTVARETKQMIPAEPCAQCPCVVNSSGTRSFMAALCCGFVQGSRIHIPSWYRESGQQNSGLFFFSWCWGAEGRC